MSDAMSEAYAYTSERQKKADALYGHMEIDELEKELELAGFKCEELRTQLRKIDTELDLANTKRDHLFSVLMRRRENPPKLGAEVVQALREESR